MRARRERPLLLIDLAVPRDIQPACREVTADLYDMDDLQALVERNVSGREAEARRTARSCGPRPGDSIAARDPGRDPDGGGAARARRRRGGAGTGRERAALGGLTTPIASGCGQRRAIASRLLHEPTLRLKRAAGDDDAYVKVAALRALRPGSRRGAARGGGSRGLPSSRSPTPPRRRPLAASRCGSGRARRARAGAGGGVAAALGGAEVVPFRTADVGDKARFVRGIEAALLEGDADLGTRPRTCPASCPTVWRWSGSRCARTRATRSSGLPIRWPRSARGADRHVEPAPALAAARPAADLEVAELRGNVDTRLTRLDAGDYDGIVLAAGLARLDRRGEIAFRFELDS